MLSNPTPGRRTAGRLLILATVAAVLPLTATRAIEYIDLPTRPNTSPTPLAVPAPVAPVTPLAAMAPVAPVAPVRRARDLRFDDQGTIHINGQTKRWKNLTSEEKQEVRESIAEAKAELARTRIDREQIQREIREAMADVKIDKEEIRRNLAEARVEIDRAMREVDARAGNIRRSGQYPEQIKASIRASLKSVEAIDVEAITRQALASVDQRAIEASVAAAEASIAKAQADIERIEDQFEDD